MGSLTKHTFVITSDARIYLFLGIDLPWPPCATKRRNDKGAQGLLCGGDERLAYPAASFSFSIHTQSTTSPSG